MHPVAMHVASPCKEGFSRTKASREGEEAEG